MRRWNRAIAAALLMGCARAHTDPVAAEALSARCQVVQDSVVATVAKDSLPTVKGLISFRMPALPQSVKHGESTVLVFLVLPTGRADATTLEIQGTSDAAYQKAALRELRNARFTPAMVNGCPVLSRVAYVSTSLQ